MPDHVRTATLIELLAHNAAARRAVVSWSLVPPRLRGVRMLQRWGSVAGLQVHEVEDVAEMLFAHRICLPDRTVDAEALRIIEHVAADTLGRKKRER